MIGRELTDSTVIRMKRKSMRAWCQDKNLIHLSLALRSHSCIRFTAFYPTSRAPAATIIGYLRGFSSPWPQERSRSADTKNRAPRAPINFHLPLSLYPRVYSRTNARARFRVRRGTLYPRRVLVPRFPSTQIVHPRLPAPSRSISRPPAIRRPSFDDPEFVITSREPRNLAGYDVRYRELG